MIPFSQFMGSGLSELEDSKGLVVRRRHVPYPSDIMEYTDSGTYQWTRDPRVTVVRLTINSYGGLGEDSYDGGLGIAGGAGGGASGFFSCIIRLGPDIDYFIHIGSASVLFEGSSLVDYFVQVDSGGNAAEANSPGDYSWRYGGLGGAVSIGWFEVISGFICGGCAGEPAKAVNGGNAGVFALGSDYEFLGVGATQDYAAEAGGGGSTAYPIAASYALPSVLIEWGEGISGQGLEQGELVVANATLTGFKLGRPALAILTGAGGSGSNSAGIGSPGQGGGGGAHWSGIINASVTTYTISAEPTASTIADDSTGANVVAGAGNLSDPGHVTKNGSGIEITELFNFSGDAGLASFDGSDGGAGGQSGVINAIAVGALHSTGQAQGGRSSERAEVGVIWGGGGGGGGAFGGGNLALGCPGAPGVSYLKWPPPSPYSGEIRSSLGITNSINSDVIVYAGLEDTYTVQTFGPYTSISWSFEYNDGINTYISTTSSAISHTARYQPALSVTATVADDNSSHSSSRLFPVARPFYRGNIPIAINTFLLDSNQSDDPMQAAAVLYPDGTTVGAVRIGSAALGFDITQFDIQTGAFDFSFLNEVGSLIYIRIIHEDGDSASSKFTVQNLSYENLHELSIRSWNSITSIDLNTAGNLTSLDLSYSKTLTSVSGISVTSLEQLNLQGCTALPAASFNVASKPLSYVNFSGTNITAVVNLVAAPGAIAIFSNCPNLLQSNITTILTAYRDACLAGDFPQSLQFAGITFNSTNTTLKNSINTLCGHAACVSG